jgi:hypothetical protein
MMLLDIFGNKCHLFQIVKTKWGDHHQKPGFTTRFDTNASIGRINAGGLAGAMFHRITPAQIQHAGRSQAKNTESG